MQIHLLCKQEERKSEGKLSVFHEKLACVKKYFQKVCGLFRSWRLFDLKIPLGKLNCWGKKQYSMQE